MSERAVSVRPRRPARWPWLVVGVYGVLVVTAFPLFVLRHDESIVEQLMFSIAFGMFGIVGALILSRDRRNVIGALFLYGCLMTGLSAFAGGLTTELAMARREDAVAIGVAILSNVGWLLGIVPVLFFLLLLFPDGRLPSRRWRWVLWFIVANGLLVIAAILFASPELTGSTDGPGVPNPLYVPAIDDAIGWLMEAGWNFVLLFGLAIASLVIRFRRSEGVERQQIKWFAAAALIAFTSALVTELVLAFAPELGGFESIFSGLAILALPISVGIAILRYRLFDLDVVVRKAIVYALLVVFATAVYLAIVVGAGASVGRDNSLLTMVAAVLVAVTFQPVRDRLTRFANRLVYGKRATPYEVLAEFSERVGNAYAEEDVLPRMVRVLGEGIGADRADVLLKVGSELRDLAAWPPEAPRIGSVPLANGELPAIDGLDRVYPVEHAGELLGALAVRKPASDPVSPADEKLAVGLAAQAGLVLRNVRLTEDLRGRLDELRAAQKRLVAAQDEVRRRLERNIHDGAQQQLVALAVKARLAKGVVARDGDGAAAMLDDLETGAQAALEDLRDLARGIYPPLLADRGLGAALEAQASRSPLPVSVEAPDLGRYPQEVEAAVYFSVLEAMQNAAKYAGASEVTVTLHRASDALTFTVSDDGAGFDPARVSYGTGLQGIADRLGALDGTLDVRSVPGRGTEISGRIPTADDAGRTGAGG